MDSNFSSALQLTDLNDFITPSQECIKPVQIKKNVQRKGLSKIQVANDGDYMEVNTQTGKKTKLKKAEVNLPILLNTSMLYIPIACKSLYLLYLQNTLKTCLKMYIFKQVSIPITLCISRFQLQLYC